ncbi:MAG: hypothetical protein J5I81_15130 [Nitrococcus mobilis]|nr:hypothetical protein [Nitrococcus mobilis]
MSTRGSLAVHAALVGALLMTALVYWPGLAGGFALDDFPNLVDNPALIQDTLTPAALWRAAFSMEAGPTGRPLAMLSFALEARAFGLDPWVMKLTNLGLHLLNGVLVFLLLRRILRLATADEGLETARWIPACAGMTQSTSWTPAPGSMAGAGRTEMTAEGETPEFGSGRGSLPSFRRRPESILPFETRNRAPALGSAFGAGYTGLTKSKSHSKRPDESLHAPPWSRPEAVAVFATTAWLLAPINLTAVLYVIQRMESLAALFTLAGLIVYLSGRERMRRGQPGGTGLIWLGVAGGTALGVLAKESAALLPVYALLLEAVLFHARARDGRIERPVVVLFVAALVVPALLGLAWLLPGVLSGSAYANRPFDLSQRLWTEGRALWSYLGWILAPSLKSLSLYHDAYPLSTGWLRPLTTLPAALGLAGLLGLGFGLLGRRPLIALGLLWFLAGHLLVSSILPLEPVYEHRNYLPSIGIALALFALLLREPLQPPLRTARLGFAVSLILLYGLLTLLRADTWGDPLRLAAAEAARHPDSPRANYALGQMLTVLAPDAAAPQFRLGLQRFEDAARLPLAGLLPAQALIFLSAKHALPVKPQWWERMRQIIATRPLAAQDISALYALIDCHIQRLCRFDDRELEHTLALAAKENPNRPVVLTLYANYAANIAHDYERAQALMQRAVALAPTSAQFWENLVTLQIALGQGTAARTGIARLGELNRFGRLDAVLRRLQAAYAARFDHPLGPASSSS